MKHSNHPVNGPYKEYFTDGKLSIEGSYANGKKVGEWKTYDTAGAPKRTKHYENS